MQRYVQKHGLKAGKTADSVAAQTYFVQEAKKDAILEREKERLEESGLTPEEVNAELPSEEDLEIELDLQETEAAEFSGDYDNFIDPITGAAALKTGKIIADKVGKSGIGKAVKKTGQKIFGKKTKKSADNPTPFADNTIAAQAAMAAYQKKVETVKKAEIKKNLPAIIGAVLLIILITAAIVYNSDKK